jgi:phospholipase A1/A2
MPKRTLFLHFMPHPSSLHIATPLALAACLFFSTAQAQSTAAEDVCLLLALKQASAQQTVADVFKQCAAPAASEVQTLHITSTPPIAQKGIEPASEQSLFLNRLRLEMRAVNEPFALLPHRPNYLLPVSSHRRDPASIATSGANDDLEAHFQMSFKFPITEPLWNGRIIPYFAYTGRAWWQLYDSERSRPFREYNHEPELMAAVPISGIEAMGWKVRIATIGFNHQSNGRSAPQSRSWNRVVGEIYADHPSNTWSSLKVWKRLSEKAKLLPTDSDGDDNPDISRYLGNFEFRLGWVQNKGHQISLTARRSLNAGGKGALQLDWSHPIKSTPAMRWYAQGFSGYGDSLIDYNQKINRLGFGIMINDWF